MRVILAKPKSGKTLALIHKSASEGGYIVCMNMAEARRVHEEARRRGVDIPFPLTFDEFVFGRYHAKGIKRLYIDNLDQCLQAHSSIPIDVVTLQAPRKKS